MNRSISGVLLFAPLLFGCGTPDATGEANSIVFASTPELWTAVERPVEAALAPRYATLRGEVAFEITHQDPTAEGWSDVRIARHIVLVGAPTDPWMEPVLADQDSVPEPPSMLQVDDVWARGQRVTLLILPEPDARALRTALPALSDLIDGQYRQAVIERLYASGVNGQLARTLRSEEGFSLQIPVEFEVSANDSIHVFRLGNDSTEVVREVVVTWKSPPPPGLFADGLLQWRRDVGRSLHGYAQTVSPGGVEALPVRFGNYSGFEVQTSWRNPQNAGRQGNGPFILRTVHCPEQDRLYLLDGWVDAPASQRYEYLIQLETILSTFECVQ